MKRLFTLVNSQGKKLIANGKGSVFYFESKMHAKAYRNELNEALDRIEWRVSKGPDHLKFNK